MFRDDNGDDGPGFAEEVEQITQSLYTRSQDDECDFCGASEGSMTVHKDERHPDVTGSPPVVRCHDCHNDPETYHGESDDG